MPFRNIDLSAALARVANQRIEDAMAEGKFDNLQGAGQPIDLEPLPPDENARAMYWAMRLFRHNDVIPDEIRYRKKIDALKSLLSTTRQDQKVRDLVPQINALIHKLNTMGTNVKETDLYPLDLDRELALLALRLGKK